MIAIIQGCGSNIASVQFALERLGEKSIVTTDANIIKAADRVILPGVGSAQQAMSQLQKFNLIDLIPQLTQPVLGICLGMQILYESSAEGDVDCLGILSGKIKSLPRNPELTIPHMGWNKLEAISLQSPLLKEVENASYVYFVHSYAAPISEYTAATTKYGEDFSAIVQNNNFFGVQFHPERSGKVGELILRNFLNLTDLEF